MSRLLLTEPVAAAAIDLCKTCGEPAETPFAYCRAHRLTARPYQTIDINALDDLDPVNSIDHSREHVADRWGDPDPSVNPGLYAISTATKGAV